MISRFVTPIILTAGLAATVAPAAAQNVCPSGDVSIVRINKLTATGTMAGFEKAVADHKKWYADHGYAKDQIIAAPVLIYDRTTGMMKKSPDMILSFHNHSTDVPKEKQDAAWTAYVAEYRANTDIVTETAACMPK
jgi:hypothetical protein